MSNIIAIPLNKLTRSARNVRKSGGESIADLATSSLVHGLIHHLTVVEQQAHNGENSGKYEVVAGGRRFAALQRLAKQKKVPKTFAVPCHVVDPATATETSLAENIIRVAMHPADQFFAFHDLVVESGLSIATNKANCLSLLSNAVLRYPRWLTPHLIPNGTYFLRSRQSPTERTNSRIRARLTGQSILHTIRYSKFSHGCC